MTQKPYNLISVIVCTFNRCESLKDTLRALSELPGDDRFDREFIIVDNNSTDRTKSVILAAQPAFDGRLRYVHEPRQGKSTALNRGIKEAKGDILAFTDDDALVDENWLTFIYEGYKNHDPDCLFGKILPDWQGIEPPRWLLENKKYWANLAILDHGDQPLIVTSKDKHFFGINFSVKREVFDKGFLFDANLGVKGKQRLLGEDTDLFYQLLAAKRKIVYEPKVVVWHKVPRERTAKRYFRNWNFGYGRSSAKLEQKEKFVRYFNVPRGQVRALFELPLRWLVSMCSFKSSAAAKYEFRLFYTIGYISECLRRKA